MAKDKLTGLTAQQEHSARLIVAGFSVSHIAKMIGRSPTTLHKWTELPMMVHFMHDLKMEINNAFVQEVGEKIADPTSRELQQATLKSAQRVSALVDSEDEKVAGDNAWKILDATGYTKQAQAEKQTQINFVSLDENTAQLMETLMRRFNPDAVSEIEAIEVEAEASPPPSPTLKVIPHNDSIVEIKDDDEVVEGEAM